MLMSAMPEAQAPDAPPNHCRFAATNLPTVGQLLHSLHVGGAEVLAAQLGRQLKHLYRFVYFCLDDLGTLGKELRSEGFVVEVLDRKPGLDWRCMLNLGGLLRQQGIDVLHAHQYTPFFYAVAARLVGRHVPVLFTEHGRHFPDYRRRKRILVNRLLLHRRDRSRCCPAEPCAQALIANEGIPPERASVIYNGIDSKLFSNSWVLIATTYRNELEVEAGDFVIIQVARLDYLKDHATAVRTLRLVCQHLPATKLLLIGDGPERQKIEEQVRQNNLASQIRFLGLRHDVARLLPAADVFLLTSISEGIPLTVIEAMCAGLPVVATRVGGLIEIVQEGKTGWLAEVGNERELADHIVGLAKEPALRTIMGLQGRDHAHAVFSQKQMHTAYNQLYQEMLQLRSER